MVQKIITIPSNIKKVFEQYLYLTKPLNGLRPLEIKVLASFLYYNLEETENFKKDEDRWKKVFSYETKVKVREDVGIKEFTLNNLLTSLRKKKVVVNNTIQEYYIPKITTETENFKLIFNFDLSEEKASS